MAEINKLVELAHANAKAKGFHDKKLNIPTALCLIHSEVSEAMEADRIDMHSDDVLIPHLLVDIQDDKKFIERFEDYIKDTFEDELADICIRVFDLAGAKDIDLGAHILAKMRYNESRKPKHGKKY